jgi:multidrug resistance efflux pump
LHRDAGANPRRALLDAEAAIATARASLAEADKALVPARELARRINEAAKQGGVAQRQVFTSEAELAAKEARRERAVINLDQAKRQAVLAREDLAAQVELLKFDLDAAALNLEQASREETRMKALVSQKVISAEEADLKSLALQQARLQYQRARTLYDLYRKSLPDAGSAGDKTGTDEGQATKRNDPFGTGKKE